MRPSAAALALLLLPLPLKAQDLDASACVPLGDLGCYYQPASGIARQPRLLIYLRGYYSTYQGEVPVERRLESARQAFDFYGLGGAAEETARTVLISGSSHQGVTRDDVEAVEKALGVKFAEVIVAAHSGGYVGLKDTLIALGPVDRILMLDDFYFYQDLTELTRLEVSAGATCAGYFTAHNRQRYEERFKPYVACAVEDRTDLGHDAAVPRCLASWIRGETCPTSAWGEPAQ